MWSPYQNQQPLHDDDNNYEDKTYNYGKDNDW